jgi:hypothetical protein
VAHERRQHENGARLALQVYYCHALILSAAQQHDLEVEQSYCKQAAEAASLALQVNTPEACPGAPCIRAERTRHEIIFFPKSLVEQDSRRSTPSGVTSHPILTGLFIQIHPSTLRDHVLSLATLPPPYLPSYPLQYHPSLGERSVGRPPNLSDAPRSLPIGISLQ